MQYENCTKTIGNLNVPPSLKQTVQANGLLVDLYTPENPISILTLNFLYNGDLQKLDSAY